MLKEAQYLALCAACDSILEAPDSSDVRMAIPWLHVTREHPTHLTPYLDLFEPTSAWRAGARRLLLSARNAAGLARTLVSWVRGVARNRGLAPHLGRLDVLFVSHLLNASSAGAEDDFYFTDWPGTLAGQGLSVGIALINHIGDGGPALSDRWRSSRIPRVILRLALPFSDEWRILAKSWNESRRLRRAARTEPDALRRAVLSRAATLAMSAGTRSSLRMAAQVEAIVVSCQPRAIVATHEGYAWERVVFAAARSGAPGIRRIGYQHSLVFRLQHGLLRNLQPKYNPDHILASGDASRDRLARAPRLGGVSVTTAGSTRAPSRGSDWRTLISSTPRIASHRRACLVLPEGIDSECNLLFGFSIACARALPEMKFIWRLHPVVEWRHLVSIYPLFRDLPSNVTISGRSLDDDIAASGWALYRGTTAIIRAVGAGVMPVYLSVPGEMTIDPLFAAGNRVPHATSSEQFVADLKEPDSPMNVMSEADAVFLHEHGRSLFSPSDVTALIRALSGAERS